MELLIKDLSFYIKMKVAFHTPQINVRGTDVAVFDYAYYNQKLLNNTSLIIMPTSGIRHSDVLGLQRFYTFFKIITYTSKENLEQILKNNQVDVLYCIKYGNEDDFCSPSVKTVIHCVFDMSRPHGNVYAGVSKTLATKFNKTTFVPHMISLQPDTSNNLRQKLNIPENAIVFGRYGGIDTFNIIFCMEAIQETVNTADNIYFLFINTPIFYNHPRVINLPKITTDKDKSLFISTCDAYLECGNLGHSFGCAIGEFSVHNKPIIAYNKNLWNTAHLDILGNKGIYFQDKEQFKSILLNFNPELYKNIDLNCYKEYTPEKVMELFKKVFLE
jgi:hypothetical protein